MDISLLPKDILLKIISYLDIDSRRAIGIYTKLKIPKKINDLLNDMLIKNKNIVIIQNNNFNSFVVSIFLGCESIHDEYNTIYSPESKTRYILIYEFNKHGSNLNQYIVRHINRKLNKMFSHYQTEFNGVMKPYVKGLILDI